MAEGPTPVAFVRPLVQYAVQTLSKEHEGGYYHAVVFISRTDLTMTGADEHYDGRADMEDNLKSDRHSLELALIRKQRLPAHLIVVLPVQLAHNILLWALSWLSQHEPICESQASCRRSGKCGLSQGASSSRTRTCNASVCEVHNQGSRRVL